MKPIQPDLKFNEATHTYTWKGRVVPSVTQILSNVGVRIKQPELRDDRVKFADDWCPVGFDNRWLQDDTAAQFGSAFHKVAAAKLEGKNVTFPDEMSAWVGSFDKFVSDFGGLDIAEDENETPFVEYPLYSEKYGYCGTFDALGTINKGKDHLVYDWKTSTGKEDFWPLQLAAYSQLISEFFGFRHVHGTVVRFGADGYKVFPVYRDGDGAFSKFLSCLNVYKIVAGG